MIVGWQLPGRFGELRRLHPNKQSICIALNVKHGSFLNECKGWQPSVTAASTVHQLSRLSYQ
jgi:hypothetical protein